MTPSLSLGLHMPPWSSAPPDQGLAMVREAEHLGFDSVWTAEGYGNDALTPLAWWGSHTNTVRLGTAVAQIPARPPTITAMSALTLDLLSGGRIIVGLGVSGPQVAEGWYGTEYTAPLGRTREYVEIVRSIARRDGPLRYDGQHYQLPLPDGTGLGKALQVSLHPHRHELPIFIGAEGPKNIAQTAEIADGWLAAFYSPYDEGFYRRTLAEGFNRPGARRDVGTFEIVASVPIVIADDVDTAANRLRGHYAMYFGGMGTKGQNFHANVARRMGYDVAVDAIQSAYLDGRRNEAESLVPRDLIEKLAIVGPIDKIRDDVQAWRESMVTTINVQAPDLGSLRQIAELVLG
jgi:F420-dependent oxidoreductase-like protein